MIAIFQNHFYQIAIRLNPQNNFLGVALRVRPQPHLQIFEYIT